MSFCLAERDPAHFCRKSLLFLGSKKRKLSKCNIGPRKDPREVRTIPTTHTREQGSIPACSKDRGPLRREGVEMIV